MESTQARHMYKDMASSRPRPIYRKHLTDVMWIVEIIFCSIRERKEMKSIQIILAKEKESLSI